MTIETTLPDTAEVIDDILRFEEDVEESQDDTNSVRTHIINPPNNLHIWQPGMTAKEIVEIARMSGYPVKALCGYVWYPKRDPEKYPACENCMKEAEILMREAGE